jgi:hypothetical protein
MAQIQKQDELALKVDTWFGDIIDHIKVDHFLITNNAATKETKSLYDDLIHGDGANLIINMRRESTRFFITKIINDYINELKSSGKFPLKLAMGLSDSKLLVWSEIRDNDEETENALLIAEAKVNGRYYDNGFYINSTIIESSDNLSIPPHYQTIIS